MRRVGITNTSQLAQTRPGRRLVVFGWHNVEATPFQPMRRNAGPRGFWAQLRIIQRLFTIVPLAHALAMLEHGEPLPRRSAALTFDDGYRDNLEIAMPMLSRLGVPASFFLVPSFLDGDVAWWERIALAMAGTGLEALRWGSQRWPLGTERERQRCTEAICELLKPLTRTAMEEQITDLTAGLDPAPTADGRLFLNWEEAHRLAQLPNAEIGSHSRDHSILGNETADAQLDDLATARTRLRDGLGVAAPVLAYPNGTRADYNASTVEAARSSGHIAALTTRLGINGPGTERYELRRIMLAPHQGVHGLPRALVRGPL